MRDIPLRASFVVYTLVAFLIGMLICLVVGALVFKPLGKYIRGEDLKK